MNYPPPGSQEIAAIESAVGHPLPTALLAAYALRGNGGFGPAYGLLGLASGHTTDLGDTALSLYQTLSAPDPDDPGWSWPSGLLPVLHVGCAIYHCVNLALPPHPVVQFDPNPFGPGDDWRQAFSVVSPSLESWLGAFANCAAACAAGAAPVRRGDPGYGSHLDRDNDGVGCE